MTAHRRLGSESASLEVSALGLGCMGMTYAYGSSDESESLRTLARSLDLGINFWDTSDSYGPFTNEELLSKALPADRAAVTIASKFGQEFRADGSRGINGRPEYIRSALEGSLHRLGTDYLDLYYQHRIDPSVPVEETWGALSELVTEGKVRYLGLSEASAETIRRAHSVHPVTALQTEWSLWTRDVEGNGILETTRELGIGFVPYSPLGRGFLTGTITSPDDLAEDDGRRSWPRFQPDALQANKAIAEAVRSVASRLGASPAQVAIAWLLAQGSDVVPIPGARKVHHLEDNTAALDFTLDPDTIMELDTAAPIGAAVGDRYPAPMMKALNG